MQPINQNEFEIPGLELRYVFLNPIQPMTGIQNKLQITKLDFFFLLFQFIWVSGAQGVCLEKYVSLWQI